MQEKKTSTSRKYKPVHVVAEQQSDTYKDIMTIREINVNREAVNQIKEAHSQDQQLFAGMLIEKTLINFQIDCGATCHLIPIHLLNPDVQLEHTEKVLVMYNKTSLSLLGKCKVKVRKPRNNKLYRLEFQVIDQHDEIPLLGRKTNDAMELIKVQYDNILAFVSKSCNKHEIMEKVKIKFEDVFTGDGCMEERLSLKWHRLNGNYKTWREEGS